ncbi:DUF5017 domain-containing protein [Parapedobacter soli]|uniref:DUF5017 domain-containing protein n=1 Tax=Parapedobacter soli TaxID=416955 RepID=UPI0021C633F5|nr:DUF5017 domain-containing protein [Parapedobacter soli]
MRYIVKPILSLVILAPILFAGCEKVAIAPKVNLEVVGTTHMVDSMVHFKITGNAETYVIYTGDTDHEFAKSYLAVVNGSNPDLEKVVLSQDSLEILTPWLALRINNRNAILQEGEEPVDEAAVLAALSRMVGKVYSNKEIPRFELTKLMPIMRSAALEIVDNYFEDHSTYLTPEGGFSTGVAIDRYHRSFSYAYSQPGKYTVTLVATNVGDKKYSGSGYIQDRTSSASEYGYNRVVKSVEIEIIEP